MPTFNTLTIRYKRRLQEVCPDPSVESRAVWRAAVDASTRTMLHSGAPWSTAYEALGIPTYTGRWKPPSAEPLLTDKEVRDACKEDGSCFENALLDTFVPECATNALVTGPDTIQLTSRVFYGVQTLRRPVVLPDGYVNSGHMLQFVYALVRLGVPLDSLVTFGHSAPVGACLLSPERETQLIRKGVVAAVEDKELTAVDDLIQEIRYGYVPTSPDNAHGTRPTLSD
jgi:hypothetical protein